MKNIFIALILLSIFACNSSTNTSTTEVDSSTIGSNNEPDALDTTGGKGVFFVDLKDGQVVKNPLRVKMGVSGMEVEIAGPINAFKGHHHIIIDGEKVEEGMPIPLDETHIHFGKGQTETELTLSPGKHVLTLQFANGVHASYGTRWARSISVNVK